MVSLSLATKLPNSKARIRTQICRLCRGNCPAFLCLLPRAPCVWTSLWVPRVTHLAVAGGRSFPSSFYPVRPAWPPHPTRHPKHFSPMPW